MQKGKDYITKEKRTMLEVELADLKGAKRKEILEALSYAKSLGDLSENAEYHQAREDQAKLEERISKIEAVLQSSETVSGGGGDVIEIGSKVTTTRTDNKSEKVFQIVGSEEADMSQGKISNRSPLGEAFFGKKKGDKIEVSTPNGKVEYKITNVA